MTQYEKLKDILREMFQMDRADLDFGIYRIMNAKRREIENFLDKELLPQVASEFAKYRGTEMSGKKEELENTVLRLKNDGADPEKSTKVFQLREEIAKYGDDEALANEVFSHLSTFFRRYYDSGDFLSLRRYKKDTYAIPYEGEEVKLHWANADQYYIKTSEYLKDYCFKLPGTDKKAHFKLVDASQEKDNIKTEAGKERKFRLHEEEPIRIEGKEVFIQFVYLPEKEKQDNFNKKTIEALTAEFRKKLKDFAELFAPAPTAKNPKRAFLEKHLYSYTARFNFDFFIHKDLGGFLRRELDFYMKNEVLFVDDLDAQDEKKLKSAVAKIKVIKHIAQKIIVFLAQLEDFQKKLWLKKKFVVGCGYCVTLDCVPEARYAEIVKNEAQCEEWVKLFAIDEIERDLTMPGYSKPLTIEFLKANPYLVLDTKHFDEQFKEKLLANFDNLDKDCDGIIINSENYQALNVLQEKYKEKVKCIYIDPPYNTSEETFVYKNLYKHSSWVAMIANKIEKSLGMLKDDSILQVAIDDEELYRLKMVLDGILNEERYIGTIVVQSNPRGRGINSHFATSHDYYLNYAINTQIASVVDQPLTEEQEQGYALTDSSSTYRLLPFRRSGGLSTPDERPNSEYSIYYSKTDNKIIGIGGSRQEPYPNEYRPASVLILKNDGTIEEKSPDYIKSLIDIDIIMPVDTGGRRRVWRWSDREKILEAVHNGDFIVSRSGGKYSVQLKDRIKEGRKPKTIWVDSKYDASSHGTNLLQEILGNRRLFGYPKSIYSTTDAIHCVLGDSPDSICLDYFAGSGTTAHAIINLNRLDEGRRKYILVEMGEYFDTVLKPRIQKVVYSKDWKDGKPVSREGISHMFKYMRLEGYDDTLDNLVAHRTDGQQKTLEKMGAQAREDYMLSYSLDIETKASDSLLNIDRFTDPFNYTLKIRKDNELKDQKIDLAETFNYLIGLYVEQVETIRGFKVVRGKLRTGEKTLVIWRNTKEKSNVALDEFFKKQKYNTLDFEFDLIFVNGDNNLENLKVAEDKWKVRLIEEEFKKRMFEQAGV